MPTKQAAKRGTTEKCCASLTDAPLSRGRDRSGEGPRCLGRPGEATDTVTARSEHEVCSCGLEQPLGRSQPTVSHHTRLLAEAGLISGEARKWMWWQLNPERLASVRRALGG